MKILKNTIPIVLFLLLFAACTPPSPTEEMHIVLVADGRQRAYIHDQVITVGQFLEQVEVTLDELDRIVPPKVTQIRDGMTITVVRVQEEVTCEQNVIPYQKQTMPYEGLASDEERLAQAGVNGIEEVCYRTTIEDGDPKQRVEIQRVVVEAPQDEIVFVGIDTTELEPVPINGTLAYISNNNVWLMRGSSATKRLLTNSNAVDGKVFSLSPDGNQLLFTQQHPDEDSNIYFNTLWVILDSRSTEPVPQELNLLNNILYAEWIPHEPQTFSYSTAEARDAAPGWQAFNDLWVIRLDDEQAVPINVENLVESSSGGIYGWWGTDFEWSPDGAALAWSHADSIGIVDLETGEFQTLLDFPAYTTLQDWVWQPSLSWSPDGNMLLTTVHGPPFGAEQPEFSPIFNIVATTVEQEEGFQASMVDRAGIWTAPKFSPFVDHGGEFPQVYLAYLQARNPLNSINDEYDLIIADRDASNARIVFPQETQPGLTAQEFAWSPDGQHIAFIYQGNLWIVEASSGRAQQLTVDGGASSPQWSN
ncbi:G5 domain-containing protein [Chloroflexota bacterium]